MEYFSAVFIKTVQEILKITALLPQKFLIISLLNYFSYRYAKFFILYLLFHHYLVACNCGILLNNGKQLFINSISYEVYFYALYNKNLILFTLFVIFLCILKLH